MGGILVVDPGARPFGRHLRSLLAGLPRLEGRPIHIQAGAGLRGAGGQIHAGAFLRERRIAFDRALMQAPDEFERIFVHELFHFAWLRLGNPRRRSYEEVVRGECERDAVGELGWSAEWRKRVLAQSDRQRRSRRWREYVCESFCDTAAWRFSGLRRHPEFTLPPPWRSRRARWFEHFIETKRISI